MAGNAVHSSGTSTVFVWSFTRDGRTPGLDILQISKYTSPTLNFEQMMESYAVCRYRKTHPGHKHNFIQNNFSWFVPQSVSILKITCAVAGLLNKVTSLPHHPPAGRRPHQSTAIWGRRGDVQQWLCRGRQAIRDPNSGDSPVKSKV